MMRGYKIRLFPTIQQEELFYKHINACRIVYNRLLFTQESLYKINNKHLSTFELMNVAASFKKEEGYEWLNEISSQTIKTVSRDLNNAYNMFFKNKSFNKPKYVKKENQKLSFPVGINNLFLKDNRVSIPKIGKIKYKTKLDILSNGINHVYNPRISLEGKKWILSFALEIEEKQLQKNNITIGIDLGIKETATISDGKNHIIFHNINKSQQIKTLEEKIKKTQRSLSRKYTLNKTKTNNIKKEEEKLKLLHRKLKNIRMNYIYQMINSIILMNPKRIVMEDLCVSEMMKNKYMSEMIMKQNFDTIIRIIKYKCEQNDIEFIQADKYFPSSKTCSCCGEINKKLKLSDRIYQCNKCGLIINRDINAAINLSKYKA